MLPLEFDFLGDVISRVGQFAERAFEAGQNDRNPIGPNCSDCDERSYRVGIGLPRGVDRKSAQAHAIGQVAQAGSGAEFYLPRQT